MRIVNFHSQESAKRFADEHEAVARQRVYDDEDGYTGSWYVVVEDAREDSE